MRVHIPDDVKELIIQHRAHGDYGLISKRLTVCAETPDGDNSRQSEVSNTVNAGAGKFDVVREICLFYREKEEAINSLKQDGNVKKEHKKAS
jgi:hypothetical protein